ncbi:sphingomyelin phosphodiesterase-like [Haliotis rufescens]|uniref:sphingomyelin phosphodiesterase-like n=1 Tax=Haliotis rufescens TaxID=6454 RepID=UPI00201F00D2|nr:sphingomyelin phosphodiesterase-like [Haliotis rufescens]
MTWSYLLSVGVAVCVCLCWGESLHGDSSQYPPRELLDRLASKVTPGVHPFDEDNDGVNRNIVCDMCEVYVTFIQLWFQKGKTQDEIVTLATHLCIDLKSASDRICRLATREFKDEVLGVVGQLALSPTEVCGIIMGPSCDIPYNPDQWWNVSLPSTPKPPVVPPRPPAPSSPKLRMLHLTDIHIDLMYEVGSNTDCGEPVCCRSNDGKPAPGVSGAGRWGDYRECDVSMSLVNTLFQHLATINDQFDFVIFTGDIPAHDVWNQTRSQQIAATRRLTKLFLQHLPGKQVYFCVGNHESAPVNSFPPPEVTGNNSISWLYTVLAESWGTWLPEDARQTILKGAYYSVSPYPGFRIVSINTNYCNQGNWWLLLNRTDPADQLTWLTHVLQEAEDAGEKVFILTHIPPGKDNCLKPWSWNYYRIVNRYESTIMAQFYGHTHKDQFEVFYDDVNFTRPTSIGYVMGGVTTRGDMNPSYRIYTMDGNYKTSSWAVLDFETYYTDIATANKGVAAPVWQLEYTAKSDYNMTGLYPRDWSDLIYRMRDDDTVFQKFYKLFYKLRDNGPCTGDCKTKMLCELKTGRSRDPSLCSDL